MLRFDIMTAVSGIIRPCGDPIRDEFFSGRLGDIGHPILNERFKYNNSQIIYQEDVMNVLTEYSGYSNSESDYVRKCISSDSMVSMSDGTTKRIDEVNIGDYVLSLDKNGKIVKSKIINKWNNGYKKVYNLKTKNGYSLKCTDDHKILCEDKFYELKNITSDMFVYTPRVNKTHLDGLRGNQRMEWKTAFMIGLLLGDGSISKDDLELTNNEMEIIEFYMDCVSSYFKNSKPEFTVYNRDGISVDKIYKCNIKTLNHRKSIRDLIRKHDINSLSGDKKIPLEIMKYQESKPLIAILAGLFNTDGYVCESISVVEYSSKSKQLSYDIKNALLKLGIYSYISTKSVSGYDYEMYVVRIVGSDSYKNFLDKITNYIVGVKREKFIKACINTINKDNKTGYMLPNYHVNEINNAVLNSQYSFRELFHPMEHKSSHNISSEKAKKIINKLYCPESYKLLLSDILPIKVENIEYYDECEVYDIEVENTHNFIANGIVVHNCISKKGGTDKVISEFSDRFPKYFKEHYNATDEQVDNVLNYMTKVMKACENYAFNIAHARPYTATGFLCAYFRCYHPKEYITASLNTFKDKKEKIKEIYKYIYSETNISIEAPVFGRASMDYSYDKFKDVIYEGMAGLKGVSKNIESALNELPSDIDNYLDLLIYIKENKLKANKKDLNTLIKVDFFRCFGSQKYLLGINEIFFEQLKYNPNVKENTKAKKVELIQNAIAELNPHEDFTYAEKMLNELAICGRTSKKMDWLDNDALFVLSLEHPYPSQYVLKGFNMKTGDVEQYKVQRDDMVDGLEKEKVIII
ncbi:MAG: LAGLIDADG family homing endonuclease, partial [Cetobacterium sp.]